MEITQFYFESQIGTPTFNSTFASILRMYDHARKQIVLSKMWRKPLLFIQRTVPILTYIILPILTLKYLPLPSLPIPTHSYSSLPIVL